MTPRLPRGTVQGLAVALAASATTIGLAFAQERGRARDSAERASGVIVKVEAVTRESSGDDAAKSGRDRTAARRLTINTAAVWRDWARDQASQDPSGSTKKAAEKGANSVATKGEPQDPNTLVVVVVGADTKVETRYRASTDETSRGYRTVAEAREGSRDPAEKKDAGPRDKDRSQSVTIRAPRTHIDDLKPGLFVDVDFRRSAAKNVGSSLTVIRPVGGPDTPAAK